MEEEVLYKNEEVTLTPSQLVAGGKTYALKDISHVQVGRVKASKTGPLLVMGIGTVFLLNGLYGILEDTGTAALLIGMAVLWLGIRWHRAKKDSYSVRISTGAGESDGLLSKDKAYIQHIAHAINEAIINRG